MDENTDIIKAKTDVLYNGSFDGCGGERAEREQNAPLFPKDISSVSRVRYVPCGDWEGRPYLFFVMKDGTKRTVYGEYLGGAELQKLADEIQPHITA